jgi:4-methylaminobutanoate oxidase (formaldehyde-forming)
MEVAGVRVRALRLSYVGELGWELHAPFAVLPQLYDALMEAGRPSGIRPAGHYAIQAMRLEKGFRAWGHELSPDDTPLEAGLGFTLDWDHPFIGRERLLEQRGRKPAKRLVSLHVDDPEATLWGSEPLREGGETVGYTTSAFMSPTLGGAVAFAYVRDPEDPVARIRQGEFTIEVAGKAYAAKASLKAFYDPQRKKMLAQ